MEIDHTPAGPQHVLPGAEKARDAVLAQRRADAPLAPKVPQKPAAGMFGDGHRQTDLVDWLEPNGTIVKSSPAAWAALHSK
jgi:hypothetical protein